MTYSHRSIENTCVITGRAAASESRAMRWSPRARVALGAGEKTARRFGRVAGYGQASLSPRRARAGYNDALIAAAVDNGVTSTPWWRMRGRRYGGITDLDDEQIREMVDTTTSAPCGACAPPSDSSVRRATEATCDRELGAGFARDDEAVYAGTKHAQVGSAARSTRAAS